MPPAAKKDGPNIAMIALIALVVVAISSVGGCLFCVYLGDKPGDATASADEDDESSDDWVTSERPFVKFRAPPGWTKHIKNDWAVFESADETALFAFTTFDQPNESTAKLGKAAGALGVTDIAWGSPTTGSVGKEGFSARIGDGTCNFKGPNGYIEYATVNPGSTAQILLIYAVTNNATQARKEEAQVAIRSLQRR